MQVKNQAPKWRFDREAAGVWRIAVEADVRPGVELSEACVRLEPEGAQAVELQVPPEAQPVDLQAARCTYSKRRRELVIEWPRAAAGQKEEPRAEVQAEAEDAPAPTGAAPKECAAASAAEAIPEECAAAEAAEASPEAAAPRADEAACEPEEESAAAKAEVPQRSADEWKALGNEAVSKGDNELALEMYTGGLKVDPSHAILLSNRALCLHRLGRLEEALTDAQRCATLRPDFMKGFLRAALILRELGRPVEALSLLKRAPKNDEIEKISAELRPEVEAAEAARIASLSGAEQKKEQGNALFKKGLFEQALVVYDEALAMCSEGDRELSLTIRNNRAGCHHQLSNFHGVVDDTTAVLEADPDNLKALVRRMIALEPLEKYERALEDARKVLRHCPGHEAANKLQHRLGKLVRERQRENSAYV